MTKTAVIFGGTGFIGLHFTKYLLDNGVVDKVVLADIKTPEDHVAHVFVQSDLRAGKVVYEYCDVRSAIKLNSLGSDKLDFIANFAAIHREPGHQGHEYYETNIPGAQNVCAFAEQVGCATLLFTSSISPYGPTESPKDESVVPTPETAYGGSKLAAELIHHAWWTRAPQERTLLTVRPGVVFGPGEGGNVSRLVAMLSKGFFVYAGNRQTRKAGIYVRELCHAMLWLLKRQQRSISTRFVLANMTMNPGPSMEEYVSTISSVSGKKVFCPTVPRPLLLGAATVIGGIAGAIGINQPINRVRVAKLVRSNNIVPGTLSRERYEYVYTLRSAMEDWKALMPSEWK